MVVPNIIEIEAGEFNIVVYKKYPKDSFTSVDDCVVLLDSQKNVQDIMDGLRSACKELGWELK